MNMKSEPTKSSMTCLHCVPCPFEVVDSADAVLDEVEDDVAVVDGDGHERVDAEALVRRQVGGDEARHLVEVLDVLVFGLHQLLVRLGVLQAHRHLLVEDDLILKP